MEYFKYFFNIFNNIKDKELYTSKYEIFATDRKHLENLINKEIKLNGYTCDLNHINVSNVIDMAGLFQDIPKFNGNISQWDVSNVKDMSSMFSSSEFNGDISKWNVSNVEKMIMMFYGSFFNQDISNWDVSHVTDMIAMFSDSHFKQDISKWIPINLCYCDCIFDNCDIQKPYWIDKEDRKKFIDSYLLYKQLNSTLVINKHENKKMKI